MATNIDQQLVKISVIVATHNRADILPRCIESLLNQTFHDFEIIIVDDASSDNTSEVIQQLLEKDHRIRTITSLHNVGPGAARNLAINEAKGEFVAIIDDDDVAVPERLEIELDVLEKNPQLGLVCSSVAFIDKNMNQLQLFPSVILNDEFPDDPRAMFLHLYLEGNIVPNTTIMTHRSIWKDFQYPENLWVGEDRVFFTKLAAKGIRFEAIKQPLVRMNRDPDHLSLTSNVTPDSYREGVGAARIVKKWLKNEKIHDFDKYHGTALSKRFYDGVKYNKGIDQFMLLVRSLLHNRQNEDARKKLHQLSYRLLQRVKSKILSIR